MKTKGFYWHIHHDVLVEWTDDINERIRFIKENQPEHEIKTRLKLMKPVKGKLPEGFVRAYKARDKADKAWDKAYKAWDKAYKARDKAYKAWVKAYKARDKARDKAYKAWDKAWDKAYKAWDKYKTKIEALHEKECPDCHWDGKTIFPQEGE